jgi:hypothetical protein
LFKSLFGDLLAILALPKGFRQLGYLLLKVEICNLCKSEVAFKLFRFIRQLLVDLLLFDKLFNSNFPKHGRFKSIILLVLRKSGRRV